MKKANPVNQKLMDALSAMGVQVIADQNKKSLKVNSSLSGALSAMKQIKRLPFNIPGNQEMVSEILSAAEFNGGSMQDLLDDFAGKVDMGPFRSEKERLRKSGLLTKLKTTCQDLNPKRKRRLSEYDGEWQRDREWEIKPYQETYRMLTTQKTLEIRADFSISAYAEASDIDRYGAMVWALSDLIESSGIQTRIVMQCRVTGMDRESRQWSCDSEIEFKKPGQYLAPSLLASGFKSRFYRMPLFLAEVLASDAAGFQVSSGLGRPIHVANKIEFKDGILKLSPDAHQAMTDEVEKEILKAIGVRKA